MSEITIHLDKEWKGGIIRIDYRWEKSGQTYTIQDIPCIKWPMGCDDYLEDAVAICAKMLMDLQKSGDIAECISFDDLVNDAFLEDVRQVTKNL